MTDDLQHKWSIDFNTNASLARSMSQPLILNNPVGLVVFGNSSSIFLAQVTDPGADVYEPLGSIKATTYIHGWTANAGRLYVLDGAELSLWDLINGTKTQSVTLVSKADSKQALQALAELQEAIQRVEWATLLENAEDEWLRLTAEQTAAPALSAERDRLDTLTADYFRMLKDLRNMVGSVGGSAAARQTIVRLQNALAEKRRTAQPWCFSPPVARSQGFEQSLRAVFTVQGNGTLHAFDVGLKNSTSVKRQDRADLQLALLEEPRTVPPLLGYISNSTLYVVDASDLNEKSHWAPTPAPPPETTHTLSASNEQFWWGTDSGVYAFRPDEHGRIKLNYQSGKPWTTRQVGRLTPPDTPHEPAVNPNELFDTMNIRSWIEQRPNASAPFNDGITAQLLLSDAAGKYRTPPEGTTYILLGPFAGNASSEASSWTQVKPHPKRPLVLLSDDRGVSALCQFPTINNVSQLIPLWATAPWLSAVKRYSTIDLALSQAWPTPRARPLTKPHQDMVAQLLKSPAGKPMETVPSILSMLTPRGQFGDFDLRFFLWHALFDRETVLGFAPLPKLPATKAALNFFFDARAQQTLRERFGTPGTTWRIPPGEKAEEAAFYANWKSTKHPVNSDPPWLWKVTPSSLFHTNPPAWYDPWGYNRPGDFISDQPTPTYLDPFCFQGNVKFPQREVTLATPFNGRRWSVFTDNDPTLLKSAKPPQKDSAQSEPALLRSSGDPLVLLATADEDRQRTVFELLPVTQQKITFNTNDHVLHRNETELGSIGKQLVAAPTVFLTPRGRFPAAWCVVNSEFPATLLRQLATTEEGDSLWEKFITEYESKYGPSGSVLEWRISKCPLPSAALPTVMLMGYNLPAPA